MSRRPDGHPTRCAASRRTVLIGGAADGVPRYAGCDVTGFRTLPSVDVAAKYFVFECGDCGHRITVNDSMRREIHEQGCVICGEAAEPTDFSSET